MGILSCGRNGCDNIMCDRHSYEYGYICFDCFRELVETGPCTDIETFMGSSKKPNLNREALARYDAAFPVRD